MSEESTVREFAERVLLAESLEEKLAGTTLEIDAPVRGGYVTPELPGRPMELRPRRAGSAGGSRAKFPSSVESEEERARLLHFFANHELLAVELMALALLKFPDAPDSFRRGVLRTLQEEQAHTRWYVERMRECGVAFGDYPVNGMIWDHIASMESPLDYVGRLSLTFEQANLDYARHYSGVLEAAGDTKSAHILEKIYHDEIAHVGYGLKWLRRWKENQESDWAAWNRALCYPLSPVRAKGNVPFNEEGRRRAGLGADFIRELKLYERSRGRVPDVWVFNPDVEAEIAAHGRGERWKCPAKLEELARDLEMAFLLSAASRDDVVVMRELPGRECRERFVNAGVVVPEAVSFDDLETLKGRQLGRLRMWGESREMRARMKGLDFSNAHCELEGRVFSKEFALELREEVSDLEGFSGVVCREADELQKGLVRFLASGEGRKNDDQRVVVKPAMSAAGRGMRLLDALPPQEVLEKLLENGAVVVEPWVEKVMEFSFLGEMHEGGLKFLEISRQKTNGVGRWMESASFVKSAQGLRRELAEPMMNRVLPKVENVLWPALEKALRAASYLGPVGVDSFFYEGGGKGELKWQPIVEVNPRWTMGRVAREWRLKLCPDQNLKMRVVKELTGTEKLIISEIEEGRKNSRSIVLDW